MVNSYKTEIKLLSERIESVQAKLTRDVHLFLDLTHFTRILIIWQIFETKQWKNIVRDEDCMKKQKKMFYGGVEVADLGQEVTAQRDAIQLSLKFERAFDLKNKFQWKCRQIVQNYHEIVIILM